MSAKKWYILALFTMNRTAATVVRMVSSEKKKILARCHAFSSPLAVFPLICCDEIYSKFKIRTQINVVSFDHLSNAMLTLMKIMLGNTNVKGNMVKEPTKFTKSPMNGNKAVTNVFTPKSNALKKNRRMRLLLENMLSSSLWNLVSRASCIGAQNN